jgi:hypothetical protein
MPLSAGEYTKHTNDNKWQHTYYTFTLRPLTGVKFYEMDKELAAILVSAHRTLGMLEGMAIYFIGWFVSKTGWRVE